MLWQPRIEASAWGISDGGWGNVVDAHWEVLTTTPNAPTARALVELLQSNGIECQVRSDTTLLGECQPCRVLVESAHAHRARWLMAQSNFSEAELTFLATGNLMCDAAKE